MRRRLPLRFSMVCPFYAMDPLSGDEFECSTPIQVQAFPERPATFFDPPEPPCWEAWGCPHVDRHLDDAMAIRIENEIDDQARKAIPDH